MSKGEKGGGVNDALAPDMKSTDEKKFPIQKLVQNWSIDW